MRFDQLQNWLDWQLQLHPTAIDMGLTRVSRVADRLEIGSSAFKHSASTVITVAGTNGKGSCVKTLEALLITSGKTVGSFTSPHIIRYNERIRLNGDQVSDHQLCQAFEDIDQARKGDSLTYFEFSTLAALLLFKQAKVDFILLEVGLGGRLDSTNIIDTDLAIVTSVDIDHCEYLGNDRESIGREKAGIFRSGVPAIVADANMPLSVRAYADDIGAELLCIDDQFRYSTANKRFHWSCLPGASYSEFEVICEQPRLPLPSIAAALMALTVLSVLPTQEQVSSVLANIELTGRLQSVEIDGIEFVLDVAHNPAAAESLAQSIDEHDSRECYAICAMMADKDIDAVIQPLVNKVDHWFLPNLPDNDRSLPSSVLSSKVKSLDETAALQEFDSIVEAMDSVRQQCVQLTNKPVVYVFGSFFTVEAALNYLQIDVQ